ncbi:MAG: ATP-binding cassette domain-containing protein [Kangiellaceae bacterium]|nr:ATP-binding cassette domain-containing protein [Kangiellaceae bacterium]
MLEVDLQCQFIDFKLEVNQRIPAGKIIGLFGSSGSGKSRLIRQLLGFDQAHQNKAKISLSNKTWQDSETSTHLPTRERRIGYLPQSVDLLPHLTIIDNILFSVRFRKKTLEPSWIEQLLLQLDINHLQQKFPAQLSGGEKQRVGIARAIVAAESLLILDEPLSAIGEDHKPRIMQLLRNINAKTGLSIIYSSHDRFEHAFLTDHLIFMDNGKVIQSGNYQQIATDINGKFAQVPDAINHFLAKAIRFDQEFSVNQLHMDRQTLWAGDFELEQGSQVHLEVRAKDISISTQLIKQTSILNSIEAKIIAIKEIAGHQYLLKLSSDDTQFFAFITKKSLADLNLKVEQKVHAMFKSVSVLPISIQGK